MPRKAKAATEASTEATTESKTRERIPLVLEKRLADVPEIGTEPAWQDVMLGQSTFKTKSDAKEYIKTNNLEGEFRTVPKTESFKAVKVVPEAPAPFIEIQ